MKIICQTYLPGDNFFGDIDLAIANGATMLYIRGGVADRAEYMKEIKKPWFAFKVLAGGAILPKDGFRYAFENGADFICVGMFDSQIVDDVNTACEILSELKERQRSWYT